MPLILLISGNQRFTYSPKQIDISTPQIAYGYSAGGAFAEFVVNVLNWKAAIGHTVGGNTNFSLHALKPFYLSVNVNDNHPNVGPAGNAQAEQNISNYIDRVYAPFSTSLMQAHCMPERFDRSPAIGNELSKSIFQELKKTMIWMKEIICAHRLML